MTIARRFARAAMAVAALTGCRAGSSGGKLTLRYRPPTGATYRYALEQQNSVRFLSGAMRASPSQDMKLHLYYTQAVTGPAAGGIGVTVTYDSTTMEPGVMAPALDRMRGLTSSVVYDDRMRILSASFTRLEGQPSPLLEQMGKSLKGISFPLPADPVGVGDSWVSEVELPLADLLGASAPIMSHTRLTLKEIHVAGGDTSIVLAVATTFPGDPVTIARGGQTATLKLSGALSGEQVYSLAKSAPVRATMGGTMNIDVKGGQTGPDGMAIALEQQTSLQLTGAK